MQLLPVISQYLTNSKLSKDKSHKTLLLLQDVSYGIKVSMLPLSGLLKCVSDENLLITILVIYLHLLNLQIAF